MKLHELEKLKQPNGTPIYISVTPRIGDRMGNFAIYDITKTHIINENLIPMDETKFVCMMCGELGHIRIMSKSIRCMSCGETYKG